MWNFFVEMCQNCILSTNLIINFSNANVITFFQVYEAAGGLTVEVYEIMIQSRDYFLTHMQDIMAWTEVGLYVNPDNWNAGSMQCQYSIANAYLFALSDFAGRVNENAQQIFDDNIGLIDQRYLTQSYQLVSENEQEFAQ